MSKIKTLFLAANPTGTTQLKLDEEIRAITAKIRASEYRDLLELVSVWAVRPDDLLQSLNEHKPQIVHFSAHGSLSGEIIFVDNNGTTKLVSNKAIKELFRTLKDNIRVVILNACYSRSQAEAITEVIDCAIGMNTAIGDQAAIIFAASFYRAIGFGRSVQEAFEQAKTALLLEGIPEENTPELLVRAGVDPAQIFLVESDVSGLKDTQENKKGDPQVISLKTALTQILAEIDTPKLMDFGCGKGTLIPILSDIPDFKTKKGAYIGVNKPEIEDEIRIAFTKSGFYKNPGSDLLNYEEFISKSDEMVCNIIIIKNVIHEITSIAELGEIIHRLLKILPKKGIVIFQDMEILPRHELGVCPYVANDLKKVFEENGLECILRPYDSFSGIHLYTLIAKKVEEPKTAKIISDKLLSVREIMRNTIEKELYKILDKNRLEELYKIMEKRPVDDRSICILRHLDYVALQKQISDYKKEKSRLSDFEIFKYYLPFYEQDIEDILEGKTRNIQDIPWFQNRGDDFEKFKGDFLSTHNTVLFLSGPRTLGKTTFALEAFKSKNPDRKPIYIKVPKNCDYWKFIENIFLELEINLGLDKLSTESKQEITHVILDFISKFPDKVIFCFEDFENTLENNLIADKDLEDFLSKLSKIGDIKCFLISNKPLRNISEMFGNFIEHKLGLFPKDYHVEQVLDALISREKFGVEKYSSELISAIGRHPAIAFLVGENIRKYGSVDLVLKNNIQLIKKRVISSILADIALTPTEEKILCIMSLFVGPENYNIIEKIIKDSHAFASLVEKGLIYFYGSNYFILDTLKEYFQRHASELEDFNNITNKIKEIYTDEFKNNKEYNVKINYHRKLTNFRLFLGETDVDLDPNDEYYSSELAELADTYFGHRDYNEALNIYEKLISSKKSQIRHQMRRASCLVRLNKPDGREYYEELIRKYEYYNIRSSYIDSLIYVNKYDAAFRRLTKYFGSDIDKYEPHQCRQRAIIEESFGNYDLAEKLYIEYIGEHFTDRNVMRLINMYSKIGDSEKALETINDYERLLKGSKILKLEKGKILVRLGKNLPAVDILEDLYNTDPSDADCLLTLVRALLNLSEEDKKYLEKAKDLIKKSDKAKPKALYIQAKILLMIEEEDFNNADRLLFLEFPDEKYGNNVYINGLKATLYMKKGIVYKEKGLPQYENILGKALEFTELGFSRSNVPLLIQRIGILREMGETALINETKEKILKINPNISIGTSDV